MIIFAKWMEKFEYILDYIDFSNFFNQDFIPINFLSNNYNSIFIDD